MRFSLIFLLSIHLFLAAGCAPKAHRQYELTGKIVAVDREAHQITVQHEDIPGLMKGMTMPFRVKDDWVFQAAHPGDNISATLVIRGDSSQLENVVVTQTSNPAPTETGVRLPQVGDPVPDFHFTDQDGRPVSMANLRGKSILLTFIYTRCPLPDYCIRMSSNFGKIARTLKERAALYDKTEQLSISFDPQYDTPKVLRAYGENYASEVDPKFTHWKFVSTSPAETKRVADFFGMSFTPGENGQIVHSLRTAIVGPDGRISRLLNGNEWKPEQAVEALTDSVQ